MHVLKSNTCKVNPDTNSPVYICDGLFVTPANNLVKAALSWRLAIGMGIAFNRNKSLVENSNTYASGRESLQK